MVLLSKLFSIKKLPKIIDTRGNLSFLENENQIDFKIKRAFWIFDIPHDEIRGGHALKNQYELIICMSGSFDVVIRSIYNEIVKVSMNDPSKGLLLFPNTWRHIENFSSNSMCLHVSDSLFEKNDYIKNLNEYLKIENDNC